ncbi:MAG: pantoate--beta-alanine ligase [candidate division Zixibacteria bacterium]|nr:pantoate--beta-alanine ligase [candidate division Zixibacteria bacterium]
MIKTSSIERVRKVIKQQKVSSKTVGLVPTMGAFHEGHLSLIRKARKGCDFVVVSIFVNPMQFAPTEDYHLYPRDIKYDSELAEENGADLVFIPKVEDIYQEDFSTYVITENITAGLEGVVRPNHFRGVATIVAKLFNIVQPDISYFGRKDAQQLVVIDKMVRELNIPVKVVGCPIIRDKNGIALSSRHKYLNKTQLKQAIGVYEGVKEGVKMIKSGISDFGQVSKRIKDVFYNFGIKRVDYVSFNRWDTLEPIRKPGSKILLSVAVKIGKTRLIDNEILNFK